MGLKILHSADWHLDSPFVGFSEEQRLLLRQEQRKIPEKIVRLCRREQCDILLLAGDLFDSAVTRETLDAMKSALGNAGVPVMISPGNHDYCGPGSPWVEEKWPDNVFVFTGGLDSVTVEALDCRVYGAGYQSMDCEGLLADFEAEGEEKWKLAVLHGDPTRKDSPYCPVSATQVRRSGLHYLALGHIHTAGAFQAGDTLCAWPGCPMGRGWDETGEKGVCIVTLGEYPDIQAVSLDTLRFYQLEVDVGGDVVDALETELPPVPTDDFYRVDLTGYGDADEEMLRRRFARLRNLEFRNRILPPLDIWGPMDEDSLEGIYFRMLHKTMESDPKLEKQAHLAAEISRKLLLGKEVIL